MGTEILKSFGALQSELEQARTSLKGFDENIKRLIGRDPSDTVPRASVKRGLSTQQDDNRQNRQRLRNLGHENDETANKRRNVSVFKRLAERPVHHEEELFQQPQKQMISKVIVTPREIPSREEALAAQNTDEKFKARNRRMFGALLGTLQKFQQEESKLKVKEAKRAQVEKRIEEHEIREKAEIKKERQELFYNRKKKQAEIKMIELKMTRMKEYALWEEQQRPRMSFIGTKAKPQIYYLPRKLNAASKALLEASKGEVEKLIEKRRFEISTELQHIEDRTNKIFENRKAKGYTEMETDEPAANSIVNHAESMVAEVNDTSVDQEEDNETKCSEMKDEPTEELPKGEAAEEEVSVESKDSIPERDTVKKVSCSNSPELNDNNKYDKSEQQNENIEEQDTNNFISGD